VLEVAFCRHLRRNRPAQYGAFSPGRKPYAANHDNWEHVIGKNDIGARQCNHFEQIRSNGSPEGWPKVGYLHLPCRLGDEQPPGEELSMLLRDMRMGTIVPRISWTVYLQIDTFLRSHE
jgi:hypothetical protein